MGLFSRKKKPSQAEQAAAAAAAAAQAAQAQQQAAAAQAKLQQDAAAQRAAAEAAEKKRAADAEREKEEKVLTNISSKRKHVEQLERAISRFEDERKQAVAAALRARNAKRDSEMKAQLRNVKRLEARSKQYQSQVVMAQQQLDALEDAASHRRNMQDTKQFVEVMGDMKIDDDEIQEGLQDMREAINNVNDINLTVQADSQLNGSMYDMDDAMAELDALEEEFAGDATDAIPNVPGDVPNMPEAVKPKPSASSTITPSEEEEIRRLEADIAL